MADDTLIIAPARPMSYKSDQGILFESRSTDSGERIGLAFTNVENLVAAMGESQPWVCLPLRALKEFHAAAGINKLAVDARFRSITEADK